MKRRDKKYQACANENAEFLNQHFETIRVEEDEKIQLIVASDVASVALSDKRVYFKGQYEGESADRPNGDIANLDSIKYVDTKKKIRPYQKYIVIIFLAIIFMAVVIWLEGVRNWESPDFGETLLPWMLISFMISVFALIFTIASFDLASYRVLRFVLEEKKYGIEIRNMDIYDEVHKIVLVAKQKVAMQANDKIVGNEPDKINRLMELSKLCEQGLIQTEEFEQLKKEIMDNQ